MEKVNARTQALTRPMAWGEMPAFTAQNAQKKGNVIRMMEKMLGAAKRSEIIRRSVKKYGIGIAAALLLWSWTAGACAIARNNAIKETEERLAAEYAVQLEQYKAEQARAVQAEHFLSGDASREAFVNQEIDAAARLAAKMSNDTQKGGIICNALARVMNKAKVNRNKADQGMSEMVHLISSLTFISCRGGGWIRSRLTEKDTTNSASATHAKMEMVYSHPCWALSCPK